MSGVTRLARLRRRARPSRRRQHGEPASLVIVEPERVASDLGAEGAVLFEQIGDRVRVVLLEPRGEGDEEKAHGRRVKHGGQHSPERLVFWGRLINGTLRSCLKS